MIQGSEEWLQARVGKVTASRVDDVVRTIKSGGWSAARKNYMAELICERLTGQPAEQFVSAAMAYGTECEPEARAAYAFANDIDVVEVGFVEHPDIPDAGASPDGLVGDDGMVEFKCPNTATHIQTLIGGKFDPNDLGYVNQIWFQMACTGRSWCDFVSYDRRLPPAMRLWVQRIHRPDAARLKHMEELVIEFLGELDATVALLRRKYLEGEA